jgi:hypothetical protein
VLAPIVLSLLLIEYLCTAIAVLVPRFFLERIVRAKKEEEMGILQRQLDDLLPRIRELSDEEYEEMTRLQEAHDAILDSPENFLPVGAFVKVIGALLLSTLTVLITAFAQEWFAELAKRFLP